MTTSIVRPLTSAVSLPIGIGTSCAGHFVRRFAHGGGMTANTPFHVHLQPGTVTQATEQDCMDVIIPVELEVAGALKNPVRREAAAVKANSVPERASRGRSPN